MFASTPVPLLAGTEGAPEFNAIAGAASQDQSEFCGGKHLQVVVSTDGGSSAIEGGAQAEFPIKEVSIART